MELEEQIKFIREHQNHLADLQTALVTRVLTEEEIKEVGRYGSSLLIRNGVVYQQDEIDRKFQNMLLIQQMLRNARK